MSDATHGATITWSNSVSGNWNDAANWDPEEVPDVSGESAVIPSNLTTPFVITLDISPGVDELNIASAVATMNLYSRTLTLHATAGLSNSGTMNANSGTAKIDGNLTNGSSINILGGSDLWLYDGNVVNNGTITVNSNDQTINTALRFDSTQTLSGSGAIVLSGPNDTFTRAEIETGSGFTVTQNAGHTIRG
ncbi:MAG: hypothetical protein JXB10_16415 [Pirellulales bacterium]|nr:hypothetical protein [Pirellulales bacterium]